MNEERKKLITEIMEADAKDGLYNTQTAVDWLIEQYKKDGLFKQGVYEQAKAMEKEQITKAWKQGNLPTNLGRVLTAEEYYHETYKK
jgi:cell division protein YceG involved in septum cleavage